jgi:hypothetical protein
MDDSDVQLAAEMAAISTVKSAELVELAGNTGRLETFQNRLEDAKDKVEIVREILNETEAHEINPNIVADVDNYLAKAGVEIPYSNGYQEVLGAEDLGRRLCPLDFQMTRMMGVENFLGDFFRKVKQLSVQLGSEFRDFYLVLTQTVDSLEDQIDLTEKFLQRIPAFKAGTDEILLGVRLFNMFKIKDKVDEQWVSNVSKMNSTVGALANNYYLTSQKNLNETMAFFGGFAELNDDQGTQRFLTLPKAIPSVRFKECSYPNKEASDNVVTAKQSVELMGGAYFLDTRLEKVNTEPKGLFELETYIEGYITHDMVGFQNNAPTIYPKIGTEIKTLSSEVIRSILKLMREILKSWRKSIEGQDSYKVNDAEFSEIMKGIYESQMSDSLKEKVRHAFSGIVRKNQSELLATRTSVSNYLVLVFNGLIEICNTSISANTPEE